MWFEFLVDYFNVKPYDIWEGIVRTRREMESTAKKGEGSHGLMALIYGPNAMLGPYRASSHGIPSPKSQLCKQVPTWRQSPNL